MVQSIFSGRKWLFLSVGTADLLGFTCGMMLGWSSPVLEKLKSSSDDNPLGSPISPLVSSWIGSLLTLGAAVGPIPYAYLQDHIGRKYSLILVAIPFAIAYLIAAFAKHVALYYVARALAGLGVGGVFTVLPTYIAELSDTQVRGMLGTSINNFLCTGLLLTYAIGPYVSIMWYNLIAAIFPTAFAVLMFAFFPDTPYYLAGENKRKEAENALALIRSKKVSEIQDELNVIEVSVKADREYAGTVLDIFRSKGTTKALIISVSLCFFQQASGINVILFYLESIFGASGSSLNAAIPPIIVGAVQLVASFGTPLAVDRLGRKVLLYISAAGMVISEVPLGVYYYLQDDGRDVDAISFLPILCLIVYIVTYTLGFGPLPWTIMAELFPSNIKSAAASVTACSCWFVSFLLTFFFERVADAVGIAYVFWFFAACTIVAFLFTMFYVPETKGKSFREIQDILNS